MMDENTLWGKDNSFMSGWVQEVEKRPPQPSLTPGMPRALNPGEVYCHICQEFFLLNQYTEHMKKCRNLVKKTGGKA
jgi:hypothetical protein